MKTIIDLKQNGNLLEKLLDENTKIYLLRVYGYESYVGNIYYQGDEEGMKEDSEEEKKLFNILQMIRKEVDKQGWNDNKIVCEIMVGAWRIFIGYWDWNLAIGGSVIPNLYPPKFKKGQWDLMERISVR